MEPKELSSEDKYRYLTGIINTCREFIKEAYNRMGIKIKEIIIEVKYE